MPCLVKVETLKAVTAHVQSIYKKPEYVWHPTNWCHLHGNHAVLFDESGTQMELVYCWYKLMISFWHNFITAEMYKFIVVYYIFWCNALHFTFLRKMTKIVTCHKSVVIPICINIFY